MGMTPPIHMWHDQFIYVTWREYPFVWHDSFISVTRLIYMCDTTYSYMWHDSFINGMTHSYVWHGSFICVTCLIHMCDVNHSYVWHDKFIYDCVTGPIHICEMTHSYLWRDSFIWVTWMTWHIHMCGKISFTFVTTMCGMTPSYVWHDSFICVTDPFICVTWLIHMCDMTHSCVWQDSFLFVARLSHMCIYLFLTQPFFFFLTQPIHMWHNSCKFDMTHMWYDPWIWGLIHLYVTRLIQTGHDSFLCVMLPIHAWQNSFIYMICLIYISHDWCIYVTWIRNNMSHMCGSCHTWRSRAINTGVMSHTHIYRNADTWPHEPRTTCQMYMSHVSNQRVSLHMKESCHTWKSHVTHTHIQERRHWTTSWTRNKKIPWTTRKKKMKNNV